MFIDIKGARKQYGSGETLVNALDGVDISLDEGKIYVILGPSGSGKSTLLNMIGGLDSLDSGTITISGRNISNANKKDLTEYRREDIGFVFQFYNLIPDLTVQENIEVVSDISKNPMDIDEVLEALDISKYRRRFPKELSGGQQQRVAIARALVARPEILFADEPTGNLDSKTSDEVIALLKMTAKKYGQTIVMITHDDEIAQVADRILIIEDGKVVDFR